MAEHYLVLENLFVRGRQHTIPLQGGTIGRDAKCLVVVSDAEAEDFHCQIGWEPEGWFIRDCVSGSGTFVNGKAVRKERLKAGDTITFANQKLKVFRIEEPSLKSQLNMGVELPPEAVEAAGAQEVVSITLDPASAPHPVAASGAVAVPAPGASGSRPDHLLMESIKAGGQTSWGKLYERHHPGLLRFCASFTANPQTAEDCAHEAFLRLKEKADTFQEGAEVRPWLYKIARNICLEHQRKQRDVNWGDSVFATSRVLAIVAPGASPMSRAAAAEMSAKAKECLANLSEDHRTVFLLKYVEGLSREEIAQVLDVPEATVKSRLYHAMLALREKFQKK